tara:strand:- start:367 stop:516 length:150 start_codon:yes stop_codon:yes gene_type:complete
MSYKQSWHRTNKQDFKKYQYSKIWDNLSKKDKDKIKKQGIEILEEKKRR